jgi:tetratricopeptide (TPR) repeat protein
MLGKVARADGRRDDARALMTEALAIVEAAEGSQAAPVGGACIDLGNLEFDAGEWAAAERWYRRAVETMEAAFGPDHPHVGVALGSHAGALDELGRRRESRAAALRSVRILQAARPDHTETATAHHNYGRMLHEDGKDAEARPHLERALELRTALFGATSAQAERTRDILDQLTGPTRK